MEVEKKHVNIEFFDEASIENFITCLHFKIDKVFFFGYEETMTEEKQNRTKILLKEKCNVGSVKFKCVNKYSIEHIVEQIENVLKDEQRLGNLCYFDLTGGEDLILVAFGMLAQKYGLPIHEYDVEEDRLISFANGSKHKIDETAEEQEIKLKLDDILAMQGGCVNYKKQKSYKMDVNEEYLKKDIIAMWKIAKINAAKWNLFSAVLKDCKKYTNDQNKVVISEREWKRIIDSHNTNRNSIEKYLKELHNIKVMTLYNNTRGVIEYSFKSESIEMCILDAGCLLELVTFYDKKNQYGDSDVRVGVHLDWDGVIEKKNVENEIDVMVLDKNIPIFISCKNGNVQPTALYELDTIAEEMGGKYAKKELVVGEAVSEVIEKRAKQMNITVRVMCN